MFKFLKRQQPDPIAKASIPVQPAINAQALLSRMAWTSAKRLDGLLQGDYRTLFRGAGLMLADLREYEPQDDVRHIDWNVTARMQTPYVRQHEQDRELAAWFLVDLSASVSFGSGRTTKRMIAAEAVATLGHLLTRHGNRIGAILDRAGPPVEILPARSGQRHLLHLLQRLLNDSQATSRASAAQHGVTSLQDMLTRAGRLIRQRATVFIVSDFYTAPDWDKALLSLAKRHDVVAIRLVDPLERELPDMGMLTIRDPETGEQVFVDTSDKSFRQRFERSARAHEARLLHALSQAGVDCLELDTHAPVHEGLRRFIVQRQQMLRQSVSGGQHAALA